MATISLHASQPHGKDAQNPAPLYVAFIWNQHQPVYKDLKTGSYEFPWVRLHGAKSYYQMVAYLKDYKGAKATFNLTPSLLLQIQDYLNGSRDKYFILSEKSPEALTAEEKEFIIKNFFVFPRFAKESSLPAFTRLGELKQLSGNGAGAFKVKDVLDLQLLHNLAWINPVLIEGDTKLAALTLKNGNFTEKDKKYVLNFHVKIMKKIIKAHREAQEEGKAEIITTPYYHPILPLLIDTNSAGRCSPGIILPRHRFQFPQDASQQVKKSIVQYRELFGIVPSGLWPSEQAVSAETVAIMADEGIKWAVTDENVLSASLKLRLRAPLGKAADRPQDEIYVTGNASENLLYPEILYRPYLVEYEGRTVTMLFRDQFLSDQIGFRYSQVGDSVGAEDLMRRLQNIRETLKNKTGPFLITIALDGENCWEHYSDDSRTFFRKLYSLLESQDGIILTTPSEFIGKFGVRHSLPELATGSWNGGNLDRWVGTPSKNKTWDYLFKVRNDLVNFSKDRQAAPEKLKAAWEAMFAAEGSDYAWWLDSMPYERAKDFDDLFRLHLSNVYLSLDKKPPSYLSKPVLKKPVGEK